MMERPEMNERPRHLDLVDQLSADEADALIQEALAFAGVEPVAIDWDERRRETLRILERIESALDRDLAALAA
jgi:hypothetical protein